MQNFNEKHPHVIENVGCRCKICEGSIFKSQIRQDADEIYMMDRLKSICKFKEKQVADISVSKKASATMNIKAVQIHQLSKKHLRQQINPEYRYIRSQKSKSIIAPPISITVHHKARKRLCNPANWSRACPTKLSRSAQSFSCLGLS